MKVFKLFLLTSFLAIAGLNTSEAVVTFVEQEANQFADADDPFTQGLIDPIDASEGDFEILVCGTSDNGTNSFNVPAGNWTEIDQEACGSSNCLIGLFYKFTPEPNNISTSCSWTLPTITFAGGILAYTGVDTDNPIITHSCNSGTSPTIVFPSINTESGSMVVRYTINDLVIASSFENLPGSIEFGKFLAGAEIGIPFAITELFGYGEPFENAGIAPEVMIPLVDTADWVACTIGVRMAGSSPFRPVPTLNEWGLIVFALAVGLCGVWFIRRKSITA
ncbi:MAG: IPTL-CTERM sorting domain-containing protein [Thermodesulfobacteriota bacterium]